MISVVGFLVLEKDDTRLYLSEEDYKHLIMDNGIFIDANKEVTRDVESKDLHYVLIAGIFKQKGLSMHFPGGGGDAGITEIRRCIPWLEPAETHPRSRRDR